MECPTCTREIGWLSPALNLKPGMRKRCPHCGGDMLLVIPRRSVHLLALAASLAVLALVPFLARPYQSLASLAAIVVVGTCGLVMLATMRLDPPREADAAKVE
jgi:hypothetical protein